MLKVHKDGGETWTRERKMTLKEVRGASVRYNLIL